MKRFQFKFAVVLQVRQRREDEALRYLASKQKIYQDEINKKAALLESLKMSLQRREALGAKPVGISEFHAEQDFIGGSKQRMVQADQAIFRANRIMDKAFQAYLVAKKQRKMIETLREKAEIEFKKERNKREEKEMNDLTVMRTRLREDLV